MIYKWLNKKESIREQKMLEGWDAPNLMKQKLEKPPLHQYRAPEDRFMTEIDSEGEWGVPPADGCLGGSSVHPE